MGIYRVGKPSRYSVSVYNASVWTPIDDWKDIEGNGLVGGKMWWQSQISNVEDLKASSSDPLEQRKYVRSQPERYFGIRIPPLHLRLHHQMLYASWLEYVISYCNVHFSQYISTMLSRLYDRCPKTSSHGGYIIWQSPVILIPYMNSFYWIYIHRVTTWQSRFEFPYVSLMSLGSNAALFLCWENFFTPHYVVIWFNLYTPTHFGNVVKWGIQYQKWAGIIDHYL